MDRLELAAARRPNLSVTGWVRGWESLVWHARLAALGAAALVLANVALSPDRLWSAWPLAAWGAVLLVHAAVVGHAWRASGAPIVLPNGDRAPAPGHAGATPVFAADSPTVERPRQRPIQAAAVIAQPAAPIGAEGASDGARAVPERRWEPAAADALVAPAAPPVAAMRPAPADVVVEVVAQAAPARTTHPAPDRPLADDPRWREREDVAVSVVVLPEDAARARTAAPPNDAPPLPDHVVSLWKRAGAWPAAPGWAVPPARYPAGHPAAPGWPEPTDGAGAS